MEKSPEISKKQLGTARGLEEIEMVAWDRNSDWLRSPPVLHEFYPLQVGQDKDDIVFETFYHNSGRVYTCLYRSGVRYYLDNWKTEVRFIHVFQISFCSRKCMLYNSQRLSIYNSIIHSRKTYCLWLGMLRVNELVSITHDSEMTRLNIFLLHMPIVH